MKPDAHTSIDGKFKEVEVLGTRRRIVRHWLRSDEEIDETLVAFKEYVPRWSAGVIDGSIETLTCWVPSNSVKML